MQTQSISMEQLANILEEMTITKTQDLGTTLIHTGHHPEHEEYATVQCAASGKQALITYGVKFI
jgi:hypothetical protein